MGPVLLQEEMEYPEKRNCVWKSETEQHNSHVNHVTLIKELHRAGRERWSLKWETRTTTVPLTPLKEDYFFQVTAYLHRVDDS